jgi:hypothetical protein
VIFLLIAIYINMMEIREEIFISIIKGETMNAFPAAN